MNKHLTWAACCCLPITCGAQSGVTLAGSVDAGPRYVENQNRGSVTSLVSGSNATGKLIIRGAESMGPLSSAFHLEHGFTTDTGTPVSTLAFWDRRATVSLAHQAVGELRLGRDYVPTFTNWVRFDPFAYVGAGHTGNLISATPLGPLRSAFGTNFNTTVRSNNAVQYFLPAGLAGIEGSVMLAPDEGGTPANGQYKLASARLAYAAGAWFVSAAAASTHTGPGTPRFEDTAIAASYDATVVKVSAGLRRFGHGAAAQDNLLVGLWIPVGVGEIRAAYTRADLKGRSGATPIDANDATQLSLGFVYNLSKRTALYSTASRIANKGGATFVVPGGPPGLVGGTWSRAVEAGLRQNF